MKRSGSIVHPRTLSFLSGTILLTSVALSTTAQIQVKDEPRHHNVFENDMVRILDVHIPPRDTSLFHKHSTPSVFLVLSDTKTGTEVKVEPAKIHLTNGNIWFEGFYDQFRVHRVWNSDTKDFHVIDMELPAKEHHEIDPPLDSATATRGIHSVRNFKLLFDEKPVRAYRITLYGHASFGLSRRKAAMVIIKLSDNAGETLAGDRGSGYWKPLVKKGDFLYIRPGGGGIVNKGAADQEFAIFELK
ncbi:MAG TPA: hypothetical protein VK563_19130 [Puia sp.]|nr:hypothetical protein [Puia sp.]